MPNEPEDHREALGRRVREVWVAWAQRQDDPKPSWLVPWDELDEQAKEADRCLGSALWGDGFGNGLEEGLRIMTALDVSDIEGKNRHHQIEQLWSLAVKTIGVIIAHGTRKKDDHDNTA